VNSAGITEDKLKAYFGTKLNSFGLSRVINALLKYLPSDIESSNEKDSDLIILHVTGRNEHVTAQAQKILNEGKSYAVIQYVLQSSRNPDPKDWYKLWSGAKVVWSYYNLKNHIENFYHAPLGSNPNIFYKEKSDKKYIVGTNGNCYKAECVGEVQLATWQVGGKALHIGERFNSDPFVDYVSNPSDDAFRKLYNLCNYFSALRRKDGFEIVAVESLLSGTRPIMFDTPNYRQWFDGLVEFIPEASVGETVGNLKRLFKKSPKPVTDDEINEVKNRFDWEKIVKGFWKQCMT
jgi:hypothetical protein